MLNVRRNTECLSRTEATTIEVAIHALSEFLKVNPDLGALEVRVGSATIAEIHRLASYSKE